MKTYTCHKCGGEGVLPSFSHVDNGMCYACMGTGVTTRKPGPDEFRLSGKMWEWPAKGAGICLPESHYFHNRQPRTRKDIFDVCLGIIKALRDPESTFKAPMERMWKAVHLATFAWTTGDERVIARAGAVLTDMPDLLDTFRWAITELDNSDNRPIL